MDWHETWVAPDAELYASDGWAHHGLAVTDDGRLIGFRSGGSAFWVLDADGRLVAEWESDDAVTPTALIRALLSSREYQSF